VTGRGASDAFLFLIDNGTDTRVYSWDDRYANGGNNDSNMQMGEFSLLMTIDGLGDVTQLTSSHLGLISP
jgi:hypothetical protein